MSKVTNLDTILSVPSVFSNECEKSHFNSKISPRSSFERTRALDLWGMMTLFPTLSHQ